MGEHAFLLGHVEIGAGTGVQPLLYGVQDALGAGDIVIRNAQAVLRGQYLKIGIRSAGKRRQCHYVAIETAGNRDLFGGLTLQREAGGGIDRSHGWESGRA